MFKACFSRFSCPPFIFCLSCISSRIFSHISSCIPSRISSRISSCIFCTFCTFCIFCIFCISSFPLPLEASVFASHKQKYLWTQKGLHTYIFAEEYQTLIPRFIKYHEKLEKIYEKEFRWKLDDQTYIVWISPWQQVANGYASSIDYVHSVFFSGGISITERFASPSWVYTLLIHELAHLYQLNVKSPLASLMNRFFRNAYISPLPVPMFLIPNNAAPSYILEGNATYNESRFGMGGRLHSGEIRAIIYYLIKTDSIHLARMTNLHLDFPFGAESYYLGGYFFSHLSEKYGNNAVNSFFKYYARHTFIPLWVDDTFKEVFSKSIKRLTSDFLTETKKEAQKQQSMTSVPPLLKGMGCPSFNHDKEKVYFLSLQELRSPPRLNVLDKQSRQLSQHETQLPVGKVFFSQDRGFLSASSSEVNPTDIIFSLYNEKTSRLKEYDSKWVNDIRGGKMVYTNIKESLSQFHLFVSPLSKSSPSSSPSSSFSPPFSTENMKMKESSFFTVANSSPILDDKGNIYYFRQQKDQRVLYKNKKKLFSFKGFYGRLMEVNSKGFIYFIGNTPYGASLFVFRQGKIFRVLPSDTVVEARQLTGKDFLVCEVYHNGYQYKIVPGYLNPKRENPTHYRYKHDDPQLANLFAGALDTKADAKADTKAMQR